MKGLAILGSTGSIGINTLEVVRRHPERFKVVSLAAGANIGLLKKQIREFSPIFVSALTREFELELKRTFGKRLKTGSGADGPIQAACHAEVDMAVSAISGSSGLLPTMAAIRAGKDIALANKETLVMAGPVVMDEVRRSGVRLLPVDSEHSAIFQALAGHNAADVRRIILTASGGPFLKASFKGIKAATPEQALNHPRWKMGRKITVDSATLMNKGLEVIEAAFIFGLPAGKISVFIHPQSIVHSMVEYIDGSIVAQLSTTDMKGPIAYALSYPERIASGISYLDLKGLSLEFKAPDPKRFPCLSLAYDALKAGGTMPAALNAADEVAVEMFLKKRIGFTDIFKVIAGVLDEFKPAAMRSVEDAIEADRLARFKALSLCGAVA
ncbi:MAG: 1-deoxy-D-xylulose-5-phosphate reductoisomerase [Deltaproteobacteria bacterium]